MPTELEELVEFLHHGNTEIRQIATENLVGYSVAQPTLFKRNQLEPIKDLKLLVRDYQPIAAHALEILINLSGDDDEILENVAGDKEFLEVVLKRVTDPKERNADLLSMLLANLSKSTSLLKLITLERAIPPKLSTSPIALTHLLDLFVSKNYNPHATFDYLSYTFADLSKYPEGRTYFLTPQKEANDELVAPLSKIIVFTDHGSAIRRRGVANTIKNICFDIPAHPRLLYSGSENPSIEGAIGLLPYILLPLMSGSETEPFTEAETDSMLDECQLLPPDHSREAENDILITHLESLLLLTTEKESRRRLREVQVYPIVRELHASVEDEGVREGVDRLVQVLMRGEEGEEDPNTVPEHVGNGEGRITEVVDEEDEDEKIVDVL